MVCFGGLNGFEEDEEAEGDDMVPERKSRPLSIGRTSTGFFACAERESDTRQSEQVEQSKGSQNALILTRRGRFSVAPSCGSSSLRVLW